MSHTYKIFDKTYTVGNNQIRLYFKYIADYLGDFSFDLNCISIGEIESGYEDDDQLTFYPNVLKLQFTDVGRYNYEYLRQVLESYPDSTNIDTTEFKVFYNSELMFIGSVDKMSLRYSEKERILEFDLVDISQELKNLTIDNLTGNAERNSLPNYIYLVYKNIYPNLIYNTTTDINAFKSPDFTSGIYWKHNWIFESYLTHTLKDFQTSYEDIQFYQLWNNPIFAKDNYAELLKALAMQFGMVIGSETPNKVYAYKRFVTTSFATSNAINITPYLINDYTKELWLPNVLTVRNTFPTYNSGTKTVIAGNNSIWNVHDPTQPANKEALLEISTDMTTNVDYGSWMYMRVNTGTGYEVIEYILEPDFDSTRARLEDTIANLYFHARQRSKDKYEFELYGLNYSMADYYKIQQSGYSLKILRPMIIKKDLINQKTKITALEISTV